MQHTFNSHWRELTCQDSAEHWGLILLLTSFLKPRLLVAKFLPFWGGMIFKRKTVVDGFSNLGQISLSWWYIFLLALVLASLVEKLRVAIRLRDCKGQSRLYTLASSCVGCGENLFLNRGYLIIYSLYEFGGMVNNIVDVSSELPQAKNYTCPD